MSTAEEKAQLGEKVRDFELLLTGNKRRHLSDYLSDGWLVLYFYPRASTPGCTQEGLDFSALYPKFREAGSDILGCSRDSLKRQENFKAKYGFPFDLIADTEETLCRYFDVIKEKTLYGKKHMGIERSTFIIDPDGILRHEWRKVKVKGHAGEVLEKLLELQAAQ